MAQTTTLTVNGSKPRRSKTSRPQFTGHAPNSRVDIIWNTTRVCGHDCKVCCVDAIQVARHDQKVVLKSDGLAQTRTIARDEATGSVFDNALADLQRRGLELDLASKLRVLDNLDGFRAKIDISGGDPLCVEENLHVLKAAAARFGRENITLTATGAGLHKYAVADIAPFIGELNFSFDSPDDGIPEHRPRNYARANLKTAAKFAAAGIRTRAECPLTIHNCAPEVLAPLFAQLHKGCVGHSVHNEGASH